MNKSQMPQQAGSQSGEWGCCLQFQMGVLKICAHSAPLFAQKRLLDISKGKHSTDG